MNKLTLTVHRGAETDHKDVNLSNYVIYSECLMFSQWAVSMLLRPSNNLTMPLASAVCLLEDLQHETEPHPGFRSAPPRLNTSPQVSLFKDHPATQPCARTAAVCTHVQFT